VFLPESIQAGACAESLRGGHVLSAMRHHGPDYAPAIVRRRNHDLWRRGVFSRVSTGRRKHPLPKTAIKHSFRAACGPRFGVAGRSCIRKLQESKAAGRHCRFPCDRLRLWHWRDCHHAYTCCDCNRNRQCLREGHPRGVESRSTSSSERKVYPRRLPSGRRGQHGN